MGIFSEVHLNKQNVTDEFLSYSNDPPSAID